MTRDQAIEFIKQVGVGYLATVCADNTPRVRPMGMHTFYDGDMYFFTLSPTRKVAEMKANPQVEAVWTNMKDLSQVRIRGRANIVEDESIQKRFMQDNPKVAQIVTPKTEKLFCLYKITPETVETAEGLVPYKEIDW
jgi:uncharacterized pyridoxamine 5'-phosphate oxidase family protein